MFGGGLRNFWVEMDVDGRKTQVRTGPAGYDGGMRISISQRVNNKSVEVLTIRGVAISGKLVLYVNSEYCDADFKVVSKR